MRQLAAEVVILGMPLLVVDAIQSSHPLASHRFHSIPPGAETFTPGLLGDDPDCLITSAILDLAAGPLMLHLPPTHGRYLSLTLFDSAGAAFASYGSHAWDSFPSDLAVAGPKWRGEVDPAARAIRAPSETAWAVSRITARSAADRRAAEYLARRQHLSPLRFPHSQAASAPPLDTLDWPQPRDLISAGPGAVFHRLRHLIERAPAAVQKDVGREIHGRLTLIGAAADAAADRSATEALARGLEDGLSAVEAAHREPRHSPAAFWSPFPGPFAPQGPAAAIAARWIERIGAPMAEDILAFHCANDESGRPLTGQERYRIRLAAETLPPTLSGWRLTARALGAPTAGEVIGEHSGLALDGDGALELRIQQEPPEGGRIANWLAAPAGPFDLRLRLMSPALEASKGRWRMAPVERLGSRADGRGDSPKASGERQEPPPTPRRPAPPPGRPRGRRRETEAEVQRRLSQETPGQEPEWGGRPTAAGRRRAPLPPSP